MQSPYMSEQSNTDSKAIRGILEQLIKEVGDPGVQYWVSANYYEHQKLDRFGDRLYMPEIWVCSHSA